MKERAGDGAGHDDRDSREVAEQRREQMLRAALEVIVERGYADTRIADVAERAGTSPALVIYYFKTRDQLLTEAITYSEDTWYAEGVRRLARIGSAAGRLEEIIAMTCLPGTDPEPRSWWLLWLDLWAFSPRNPGVAAVRQKSDERWRACSTAWRCRSRSTTPGCRRSAPTSWRCCSRPLSSGSTGSPQAGGPADAARSWRCAVAGGSIELVGLTKRFAETAVDNIDLTVARGEFFSLLGPSGCGKTTTLRLIAGFERPTSGRILLDGTDVSDVPPHRRNVNTVFQSYALFPFLDVFGNVAFGLRHRGIGKAELRRRANEALDLVQMSSFAKRRPGQLSGGQQQRVALARALVLHPAVLLLDEPLGALDAKLRRSLKVELKALQERVGVTFLYVTHDQEEALTMSDRLAVMNAGKIVQIGTPRQVYEEPTDTYVADFLGAANLMEIEVVSAGPPATVRLGDWSLSAQRCEAIAAGPA